MEDANSRATGFCSTSFECRLAQHCASQYSKRYLKIYSKSVVPLRGTTPNTKYALWL